MKGDTQLDGDVDMDDAFDTLQYYSSSAAGKTVTFTDGSDELLEKLAFYVSDVDTESKAGKRRKIARISMDDAFNITTVYLIELLLRTLHGLTISK